MRRRKTEDTLPVEHRDRLEALGAAVTAGMRVDRPEVVALSEALFEVGHALPKSSRFAHGLFILAYRLRLYDSVVADGRELLARELGAVE